MFSQVLCCDTAYVESGVVNFTAQMLQHHGDEWQLKPVTKLYKKVTKVCCIRSSVCLKPQQQQQLLSETCTSTEEHDVL